jgi:uncharacterized membrane protein
MKWSFKRDIFAIIMIILTLGISLYFYNRLPDTIPIHYNADGYADGYSAKSFALISNICITVATYLMLTFIPVIDPFRKKIEKRYNVILVVRDIIIAFISVLFITNILTANDKSTLPNHFGIGLGLLFILLGNYLPKMPQNFFIGIRSPWTLTSEVIWAKTHRIGGVLFVIAGVIFVITTVLKIKLSVVMPFVLIPLIVYTAFIYPYWLFRKMEKEIQDRQHN